MKHWLQSTAAALTLAVCASAASAQSAPPPGASPPSGRFQEMRQMRDQMRQIETQARTQMLAALTPAHRTLLSSIVGQLAVAQTPDFRAAAQQLDGALSPAEKQSILTADANAHTQMRGAMAQIRAQLPPPPGGGPSAGGPPFQGPPQGARPGGAQAPDAGAALLRHALMIGRGPRPA